MMTTIKTWALQLEFSYLIFTSREDIRQSLFALHRASCILIWLQGYKLSLCGEGPVALRAWIHFNTIEPSLLKESMIILTAAPQEIWTMEVRGAFKRK